MPKASKQPLSALFAINKPTGIPSMTLLNKLQPLFQSSALFKDPSKDDGSGKGKGKGGRRRKWNADKVKMGQGGTLDPLADGVLVVGTNAATKSLSRFLDCTKEYRAIGLLGSSTDSYDSEGKRVRTVGWEGITREKVEEVLGQFRGEIEQTPPIYSALKMDGKPLYEYARSGTPLPRPIPARKVTVHSLELLRFEDGSQHSYDPPSEELDDKAKKEIEALEKMVKEGAVEVPKVEDADEKEGEEKVDVAPEEKTEAGEAAPSDDPNPRPPIFEIHLTVSSGTYIRSIIHDIGLALGSAAHVVKLTRTRQGEFVLNEDLPSALAGGAAVPEGAEGAAVEGEEKEEGKAEEKKQPLETFPGGCVEWSMLEKAIEAHEAAKKAGESGKAEYEMQRDAEGWLEWEREVLGRCKEV
ncbi:hypothetical protein JCM10213_005496 [Rhodosporidiobolus nylandii]